MLARCVRCGSQFSRDPADEWKRFCLPCWKLTKSQRSKPTITAKLIDELGSWRRRAMAAETQLQSSQTLDLATLKRIRLLCHPDKHGGSQSANEVTQTLNRMIRDLT